MAGFLFVDWTGGSPATKGIMQTSSAASAAYLKFLHHKRQIRFRNFK
jgi:hypothetical protein